VETERLDSRGVWHTKIWFTPDNHRDETSKDLFSERTKNEKTLKIFRAFVDVNDDSQLFVCVIWIGFKDVSHDCFSA
jgi:hypothetical protein